MAFTLVMLAVSLTVHVTLRTPSGAPAVGVPMRLVVDKAPVSQADAGTRCTTDAAGVCTLTLSLPLDERRRKMPTNWIGSLTARPQRTRHVALGIEMSYAGEPWLAVLDIDRFDDGTMLHAAAPRVFGRDARGAFTVEAAVEHGVRVAAVAGGLRLSVPGFEVHTAALNPAGERTRPDESAWTLAVVLQQRLEPVRRDENRRD
jgi:hypothetical protein